MPRRAFSLIELLISIGIIGILIALALPALARARAAAREAVALANGRSTAIAFDNYADQYKTYPFAALGAVPDGAPMPPRPGLIVVKWYPEGAWLATTNPFEIDRFWPGLVAEIAPWEESYSTWVSPGGDTDLPTHDDLIDISDDGPIAVSWQYCNSFVAKPALWKEGSSGDEGLLGATRPADVAFPSSKVMLYDADLSYLPKEPKVVDNHYNAPTPMAFADLHAAVHNPLNARETRPNPLNGGDVTRLHNTKDGVLGVDY